MQTFSAGGTFSLSAKRLWPILGQRVCGMFYITKAALQKFMGQAKSLFMLDGQKLKGMLATMIVGPSSMLQDFVNTVGTAGLAPVPIKTDEPFFTRLFNRWR